MFRSRRTAFTLVELLVVIGIIALLISILLPSLARARESANSIKCSANLHQIGLGLLMYDNDNKGMPYGALNVNGDWGGWVENRFWPTPISTYLGTNPFDSTGWWTFRYSGAFTCPSADVAFGYQPNKVNHYIAHPRLIPTVGYVFGWGPYYDQWAVWAGMGYIPYNRRTLSGVTDGASKALVWDGPQSIGNYTDGQADGNAYFPETLGNMGLWGGGGACFLTDVAQEWGMDPEALVPLGTAYGNTATVATLKLENVDDSNPGGWAAARWYTPPTSGQNAARFRHNQNTSINVLFCDGHVESLQFGDWKLKLFTVNYK